MIRADVQAKTPGDFYSRTLTTSKSDNVCQFFRSSPLHSEVVQVPRKNIFDE